jgi:hypothetical protein
MLAAMFGRHSGLSSAQTGALLVPAVLVGLASACATSATNTEHGPSFGEDAGDGSPPEAATGDDATTDGGPEASPSVDSGRTPDTGSATDGAGGVEGSTPDAGEGGPPGDGGGCTSTMALLAMGASGLAEARFSGGAWSAASTVATGGAPAPALPALVALPGGFLGAFVSGTQLEGTAYTSAWSAPAPIGTKTAQGTPALVAAGSSAYVVYWGGVGDGKYYLGTYSGSWDSAADPVEADGGAQSFGSSAPAAATVDASVVVVQSGTNGTLYDQTWTAGTWQAASAHTGTSVVPTLSPAVVALQGGTADLMVVYVRATDDYLEYTTRSGGIWSAPAEVYDVSGNIAYTGFTPTLAALPNGGAIVVWQGGNNMAYDSVYVPGTGWSAPVQVPSTTTVVAPPAVATGVCGVSATAAYVLTGGQVAVTSLTGTVWSTPVPITGATGMQSVAIATSP